MVGVLVLVQTWPGPPAGAQCQPSGSPSPLSHRMDDGPDLAACAALPAAPSPPSPASGAGGASTLCILMPQGLTQALQRASAVSSPCMCLISGRDGLSHPWRPQADALLPKMGANPAAGQFLLPVTIAMVIAREGPIFACPCHNAACVHYLCCTNNTRTDQRIENRVTDPENPRLWD